MADEPGEDPGRRGPATERQAISEAWARACTIVLALILMKLLIWLFLA